MTANDAIKFLHNQSPVFKNRCVFDMDYVPDIYMYRDAQLNKMAVHSNSIDYKMAPDNMLLTGGNATGKTSTLKLFFKMLNAEFNNIKTVYINCKVFNTPNGVYGEVYKALYNEKDCIYGKNNDLLLKRIIDKMRTKEKILILGLDDLDSFKSVSELNDMLYNFLRMHEVIPGVQVCIFTVSNRGDINLKPAVESIFNRVPIVFNQYSREQMYHILKDRCDFGFCKGVISDDLIREVADKTFDRGNLRYGIRLLRSAGREAESSGSCKILKEYI